MSIQVKLILAQKLDGALQNLRNAETKLKAHVEQNFEAIKTELEACVGHFSEEVTELRGKLGEEVSTLLDFFDGKQRPQMSAVQAVHTIENEKAESQKVPAPN